MKKIIMKLFLIIFVFITLTFVGVFFLMKSNKVLVSFSITEVSNTYNNFTIKFESAKAAVNYKVELMDSDANMVYTFITKETSNTVIINNMKYDMAYMVNVYAYDKDGNILKSKNTYDFVYKSPTINKDNILLNDIEYKLLLNGDISDKDYYIIIYSDNDELYRTKVDNNECLIPLNLYKDKDIELSVDLVSDGIVVDSVSLYNHINPVKDIFIETPSNDSNVIYNNISLIFNGGENAEHYSVNIYDGKKLISSTVINKKKVVLSEALFEPDKKYKLEVVGIYQEYTNSSYVEFTVTGRAKLKPVYINVNPGAVRKGTKVVLKQPEGAQIYYTLNGDDPNTNGIPYEEPIEINESCTLKTTSKMDLRTNSIVKEYDLNVVNKDKLKVYISPSNQGLNQGVHEVGFTTEKNEMNKVADYVIERLKEHGVTTYRNNPAGNINQWNNDANYLGVDFKLAIHSNASIDHTSYGIETWINSEESNTYSIASMLQDAMVDLYPYKDREGYNRGVKYALGEIGEANDNYVRNGVLIEIAHHDDLMDAKWMIEQQKEIGYALADAILKYYSID